MKEGKKGAARVKNWTGAFQVAAVYVGTVIGAGFATGREIVEFFTQYGFLGYISILIAGYLFIVLGSKVMFIAIEIKAHSYEQLNERLFGKQFAKVMNFLMLVMLVGVCAVMLSGAEALFFEQGGWPRHSGTLITIFFTLFVMAIGMKGLFVVNAFVVPMMIIFNIIVMIHVVPTNESLQFITQDVYFIDSWHAFLAAISYASFNLALAQAVLVPMATEIGNREIVKLGGILGGLLLTIILFSSHIALSSLADPLAFDIPMAVIVKNVASSIYIVYLFIIYGEIFTSIIGNLYGLERQIRHYVPIASLWIHGGLLLFILVVSQVNYGMLLGYLYPLFGYISIVFLILLFFRPVGRNKKQ